MAIRPLHNRPLSAGPASSVSRADFQNERPSPCPSGPTISTAKPAILVQLSTPPTWHTSKTVSILSSFPSNNSGKLLSRQLNRGKGVPLMLGKRGSSLNRPTRTGKKEENGSALRISTPLLLKGSLEGSWARQELRQTKELRQTSQRRRRGMSRFPSTLNGRLRRASTTQGE